MKILQPSKKSKRHSKSLNETGHSTRSNGFSKTILKPNRDDLKKVNGNSDESSLLAPDFANSRNSIGDTFSSKKKYRKSKYKNSPSHNKYARESEVPEKDFEYDFDTSKLEAMPRTDEFESLPHIEGKKRRRSELQSTPSAEPLELIVDPVKKEYRELLARGIRLLSMREQSVKEITNKLLDKTENINAVHAVVDELREKKYLSDERFTESYIRARCNRGFGPVKIRAELKSKGIAAILIEDYLDEGAAIWFDTANSQYLKKYSDLVIGDYNTWTKRARFLQSRGFTMEQIQVTVPQFSSD